MQMWAKDLTDASKDPTHSIYSTIKDITVDRIRIPFKSHLIFCLIATPPQPIGLGGHGGFYSRYPAKQLLASGLRLIIPDLPGYGRSAIADNHGVIDSMNDQSELIELMAKLVIPNLSPQLPKKFVMGCSLGGMAIIKYAALQCDFDGLILISAAITMSKETKPSFLLKTAVQTTMFFAPFMAKTVVSKGVKGNLTSLGPEYELEFQADPLNYRGDVYMRTGLSVVTAFDEMSSLIPKVTAPVLVMHGSKDRATSCQGSVDFFQNVGSIDKELKIYDGFEHILFYEKPDCVDDVVNWILKRV